MTSAAIYTRISADRAGTAAGVKRQEEDCRELVGRHGWQVAGVYTDNDVSAYSGGRRTGYDLLMADLSAGRLDAVVAWHPDRLHRSPLELEDFIDTVSTAGATVATVQAGEYDLATAAGRMTARVVGAVARHESEQKGERQRRKNLELAKAGKVSGGGHRPFGYEEDRKTIRADEAELIRTAARRLIAGQSMRSLVGEWNAAGFVTTAGNEWRTTPFRRLMRSGRIAGLRQHQGQVVGDAEWPGIIDAETRQRLDAILGDPSRRKFDSGSARRYLLTGLLECALCGAKLVARPRSDKTRCYVCASGVGFGGCGKIRAVADSLEEFIAEAALVALDSPATAGAIASHNAQDIDGLLADLRIAEGRLEDLAADFYTERLITKAEFLAARAALSENVDELRTTVANASSRLPDGLLLSAIGELRAAWQDGGLEWRRQFLGVLIDAIRIGPVPVRGRATFQPERVDIVWKA